MSRSSIGTQQLDGRKWQQSHQATVDAILGGGCRKVSSRGSAFFNRDNWTARSFAVALCEWARLNADHRPERRDIEIMTQTANRAEVLEYDKGITIAATPDDLPRWLAWALVGGGYHEAWHTRYSRTAPILLREVETPLQNVWGLAPYDLAKGQKGWAPLTGAVLTWSNIVEDIIIERRGCLEFPGSPVKMEALQDLILQQEGAVSAKGGPTPTKDIRVVFGAFRDLGLGYETPDQLARLAEYKKASPPSWEFVTKGVLKPFLDRAIALGTSDKTNGLESLWLAMEIVAAIQKVAAPPPAPQKAPPAPTPPPKGVKSPKGSGKEQEKSDENPEEGEGDDEEETPSDKGKKPSKSKPTTYKVGDRAKLATGDHAGRTVEIVRAGLPDKDGLQKLEFALVEDDA